MCGGIAFKLNKISKNELIRTYGDEAASLMFQKPELESRFWDERPVLPVIEGKQLKLYDWGNRDKTVDLPRTGWAREESLESGKWDQLKHSPVIIAAEKGCEKGVWFETPNGIEGIKISKGAEERVYMVTKPASAAYIKKTGHNREPVLAQKAD